MRVGANREMSCVIVGSWDDIGSRKEKEMDKCKKHNCESCPFNVNHDGNGWDYRYPCDQQNCWHECNADSDE